MSGGRVPSLRRARLYAALLGEHRNALWTQLAAWAIAAVIVALNVALLWLTFTG